jgi:DinB superfamily
MTEDSSRPFTRSEILAALDAAEREVAEFFGSLADDELVHRVGEAWTPAEHLRHLCIAVAAVARGLAVPRWLLRLRFGRARAPSRTYDVIRETYRSLLGRGAGASGPFVPRREDLSPAQAAESRAELLARWGRVNGGLRAALATWSEANLDRLRMPHPILGPLTVREMLFFTIYHDGHHVEAARGRILRFRTTQTV